MSGTGVTISNLPAAASVLLSDLIPLVEIGTPDITKSATVAQLQAVIAPPAPPGGTAIVGDLALTGKLLMLNAEPIQFKDTTGAYNTALIVGSDNITYLMGQHGGTGEITLQGNPVGISGNLVVAGAASIGSSLIVNGQIQANGNSATAGNTFFAYPGVGDFYIGRDGAGNRAIHWSNSDSMDWNEGDAALREVHNGVVIMTLQPTGDFAIAGANAYKIGGASTWIVTSDDRVKRNVEPYIAGLDAVCELDPISFEYNGQGGTGRLADGTRYTGLSAQATQPVMPEMVRTMPAMGGTLPDQLGIDLGPLTLALCNAVRELRDRIAALEALVT